MKKIKAEGMNLMIKEDAMKILGLENNTVIIDPKTENRNMFGKLGYGIGYPAPTYKVEK